ncbi:hypothetical protein Sste5344_005139 [Sporothrix stenoceras]
MRIGCLQFSPQVGDVDNNLNRADAVLNKAQEVEDLDLLVLPELAFTGYNFKSLAEISPYLEPSGSGISALWARTTALKFNCNVVVGYPEKVDVAQKWPASPEFYNSAIIVNRDGETVANYRKSFVYAIDETWALEGHDGFFEGYVSDLGDIAMGICMDLKFEAPWHEFEFAYHVLEVKANLVIVTMAWLTREGAHSFSQLPQEPDLQTLEYWVQRLEPIVRSDSDEEVIVVLCNRCGTEGDAVYAGTSTVLGIKHGEVNLYGVLGRGVKELLVVDTEKAPFARLLRTGHNHHQAKSVSGKSEGNDSNQSMIGSSPNVSHKSASGTRRRPFFPFRDMSQAEGYDTESLNTPIEDLEDAWEIMSTTASVGSIPSSYSRMAPSQPPQSARGAVPKLELQIPTTTQSARRSSQPKRPSSATRHLEGNAGAAEGEDVPTPTAPTPTPMSVRPYFEMSEKIPPVSLRSHIGLPDSMPSSQARPDSVPPFLNTKGGGSAVKVKRADTPITPPWVVGTKEKTRGPTPISEAPPSPPSDGEDAAAASSKNKKEKMSSSKKSPKLTTDNLKSAAPKDSHGKSVSAKPNGIQSARRQAPRLRTSSLSYRAGKNESQPLASAATYGLQTATPVSAAVALEALWDDALRNLKTGDVNAAGDSMYRHDDLDNILVRDAPSQDALQEQIFAEVQQKFAHLVNQNEKPPSPAPAYVPDRPPSTKSRNMSTNRAPQGFDSPELRRSMSQSRMSIPIMASPSVFRQEFQSLSQAQHADSPPIYFRAESKGPNKVDTPGRSQQTQTPTTKQDGQPGGRDTDSPGPADTPSRGVNGTGAYPRQTNRPVSRGRQPFTKTNATNGVASQNTQRSNGFASRVSNSTDRGRQVSNNRLPESGPSRSAVPSALSSRGRSMSTSSANSWLFGTPPPTSTQPPLDPGDEIIAMINLIHNDCPVHNSRAPSLGPQSQTPMGQHGRSQSQGQGPGQGQRQGRPASQQRESRQTPQRQATPRAQTPSPRLQQQEQLLLQQSQPQSNTPVMNGGDGEEPVYEVILPPHIRELVESLSSPDSRVQSPLRALDLLKPDRATPKFDPPTPTAMQFSIDETTKAPASA